MSYVYGLPLIFDCSGSFGVILFNYLKMGCNSKTSGHRAKRCEIWDLGLVVTCIWGAFGLLVFKIILGSFIALVSKLPLTRTQLALGQNRCKVGLCDTVKYKKQANKLHNVTSRLMSNTTTCTRRYIFTESWSSIIHYLNDLDFDLLRSLKVKSIRLSAIRLPIYGFLLMFNCNIGSNWAPFQDIRV